MRAFEMADTDASKQVMAEEAGKGSEDARPQAKPDKTYDTAAAAADDVSLLPLAVEPGLAHGRPKRTIKTPKQWPEDDPHLQVPKRKTSSSSMGEPTAKRPRSKESVSSDESKPSEEKKGEEKEGKGEEEEEEGKEEAEAEEEEREEEEEEEEANEAEKEEEGEGTQSKASAKISSVSTPQAASESEDEEEGGGGGGGGAAGDDRMSESEEGSSPQHKGKGATAKDADQSYKRRPRKSKSRNAKEMLKRWFFDHADCPYPSREQKVELSNETGLTVPVINVWFTNARCRLLKTSAAKPRKGRRSKNSPTAGNSSLTSPSPPWPMGGERIKNKSSRVRGGVAKREIHMHLPENMPAAALRSAAGGEGVRSATSLNNIFAGAGGISPSMAAQAGGGRQGTIPGGWRAPGMFMMPRDMGSAAAAGGGGSPGGMGVPGSMSGFPGMMPGMIPGMMPGMMPGMVPSMMPGMMPGMRPNVRGGVGGVGGGAGDKRDLDRVTGSGGLLDLTSGAGAVAGAGGIGSSSGGGSRSNSISESHEKAANTSATAAALAAAAMASPSRMPMGGGGNTTSRAGGGAAYGMLPGMGQSQGSGSDWRAVQMPFNPMAMQFHQQMMMMQAAAAHHMQQNQSQQQQQKYGGSGGGGGGGVVGAFGSIPGTPSTPDAVARQSEALRAAANASSPAGAAATGSAASAALGPETGADNGTLAHAQGTL